jgi:myo-inositol-1(or 4)-monophosphatase
LGLQLPGGGQKYLEILRKIDRLAATWEGAKNFGNISEAITKKGAIDLVTEADIESEKAIIRIIQNAFPEHSILAEESGLNQGNTENQWIIDPLDGTTNFAHELGIFAVSIAFSYMDQISLGFVLNPISGELFTAEKGKGAKLNGISHIGFKHPKGFRLSFMYRISLQPS